MLDYALDSLLASMSFTLIPTVLHPVPCFVLRLVLRHDFHLELGVGQCSAHLVGLGALHLAPSPCAQPRSSPGPLPKIGLQDYTSGVVSDTSLAKVSSILCFDLSPTLSLTLCST